MIDYPTKSISLSTGEHIYNDIGSGEHTLLLLHGFSFRAGIFPLAEALKDRFRILIPDLPYTYKRYASQEHSLSAYVDYLLEFTDRLALKKLSIFGNSLGGGLALMCALAVPERFTSVIVRSPLWTSKELPAYFRMPPLVAAHKFLSRNRAYAIWALEIFYKVSAQISATDKGKPRRIVPYDIDEIAPDILSRFLGTLLQIEIETQLPQLKTKTLIIWGKEDILIPPLWGETLENLLPNATYLEMADEYHNINTANMKRLADTIADFL